MAIKNTYISRRHDLKGGVSEMARQGFGPIVSAFEEARFIPDLGMGYEVLEDEGWYDGMKTTLSEAVHTSFAEGAVCVDGVNQADVRKLAEAREELSRAVNCRRTDLSLAAVPPFISSVVRPIVESFFDDFILNLGYIQPRKRDYNYEVRSHQDALVLDDIEAFGNVALTFLIPTEGPMARFFYSEQSFSIDPFLENPDDEVKEFVYGIGRMAVLRQSLTLDTAEGIKVCTPVEHGGYCTIGDRGIFTIDVHTDEVIKA